MKDSKCKNSRSSYRLGILAGIVVLALLVTLVFFRNYDDFGEFMLSYVWALVICATLWLGNSYIYGLLDKKYSWQNQLVKRAIFGSVALIAYSATAYLVVQTIMYKLVTGSLPDNPVSWGLRSSYSAILISFIISLIFVAVAFFQYWKKSLVDAEKFKAEMLMYKYESLQNQINPHFLFNSFNVLSDLVYEDQKKAVDFISQLSQLFRYVLDSRDKELVPLSEELEFVDSYSYLLKTRFEEKLSFLIDLEAREGEMIVPMTLQLLIENCIKHNELSAAQPLIIQISREGEFLRVRNRLQPKSGGAESKKLGLSNIRQQYRYFTDEAIVVSETDEQFSVDVPLIKSEKR